MSPASGTARPLVLVCEDGEEYLDRFCRFFGDEFEFVRVQDLASARTGCAGQPIALLCDMDFRRLPSGRLVDEAGATATDRTGDDARRLAEMQGALILRALRAAGVTTPALLFADIDDPARARTLEHTLQPVALVSSGEGLAAVAARLRSWAAAARRTEM
jgi:hypothetical protein